MWYFIQRKRWVKRLVQLLRTTIVFWVIHKCNITVQLCENFTMLFKNKVTLTLDYTAN